MSGRAVTAEEVRAKAREHGRLYREDEKKLAAMRQAISGWAERDDLLSRTYAEGFEEGVAS